MDEAEPNRILDLPDIDQQEFAQNFIRLAVCECRFPTLIGNEDSPPKKLARALRKEYPHHETSRDVNILDPAQSPSGFNHQFLSRNRKWSVGFTSSSVSLQTQDYKNFESLQTRFYKLLDSAEGTLDSDFFTRVGLRYINDISVEGLGLDEWLRPELAGAFVFDVFGQVSSYKNEVRGRTEVGGYAFRHGFSDSDSTGRDRYTLDFDVWAEDVEFGDVKDLITILNDTAFRFFMWAIGDAVRTQLGQSKLKD